MIRRGGRSRATSRQAAHDVVVRQAMEAVAANAGVADSRGRAKACATCGWLRWNAVSKQATCGICGAAAAIASIGARLCGWCSGASGTRRASLARTSASMRAGAAKSTPPWTTRWPNASTGRPASSWRPSAMISLVALRWSRPPAGRPFPPRCRRRRWSPADAAPVPDARPVRGTATRRPARLHRVANLMLEEPALRTGGDAWTCTPSRRRDPRRGPPPRDGEGRRPA